MPDLEKHSPYAVVDTMGSFNVAHTPSGRHVIDRAFCVLLCTELNEAYAAGMAAIVPANMPANLPPQPHGCICPPTAEQTCNALMCPRRSYQITT